MNNENIKVEDSIFYVLMTQKVRHFPDENIIYLGMHTNNNVTTFRSKLKDY